MYKIDYEILKSFCEPEEGLRLQLHFPFLQDGYWCATDGHVLLFAKETICDDNIPSYDESFGEFPNVFAVMNPKDFSPKFQVKLSDIESAIAKVPMKKEYDEREIETEFEECEACGGSGEIEGDVFFRDKSIDYSCVCPACHGFGKVPVSREYEPDDYEHPKDFIDTEKYWTGKMVIEDGAKVTISDNNYMASNISKVKNLMSCVGVKSAVVGFSKANYLVFHFSEVYVVVVSCESENKHLPSIKVTKI